MKGRERGLMMFQKRMESSALKTVFFSLGIQNIYFLNIFEDKILTRFVMTKQPNESALFSTHFQTGADQGGTCGCGPLPILAF